MGSKDDLSYTPLRFSSDQKWEVKTTCPVLLFDSLWIKVGSKDNLSSTLLRFSLDRNGK